MDKTTRTVLFFGACLPLRLSASFAAKNFEKESWQLTLLGIVYCIIGLQTGRLWLFNLRQNAYEGGGCSWWNHWRPLHAILFLLFGLSLVTGLHSDKAYVLPVMDVMVALIAWLIENFS